MRYTFQIQPNFDNEFLAITNSELYDIFDGSTKIETVAGWNTVQRRISELNGV